MFNFLKNALASIYQQVSGKLGALFSKPTIEKEQLDELEKILITSDTGVALTNVIMKNLQTAYSSGSISRGSDLKHALAQELTQTLTKPPAPLDFTVFLLVGINGSGKTTFAGKLAHYLKNHKRSVLLVAADTFRAAAVEQLATWADRTQTPLVKGTENQDPASVVFQGCQQFLQGNYSALIVDTAGRLQTKANLMKELEKIKKTITRLIPNASVLTLLTVDAMLGQNSFEQARLFHESTHLDGVVLTKMDGTGKGGIIFAINKQLGIPVVFLSYGEKIDQLKLFNGHEYIEQLLS